MRYASFFASVALVAATPLTFTTDEAVAVRR